MRLVVLILCFVTLPISTGSAQGRLPPRPAQTNDRTATSDEKAAEIKRFIELGQQRQRAVDSRNTKLWERWTMAICIGCGPLPVGYRIVYTTPARVLAGIPAADDDRRRDLRL